MCCSLKIETGVLFFLRRVGLSIVGSKLVIGGPTGRGCSILCASVGRRCVASLCQLIDIGSQLKLPRGRTRLVPFSGPVFSLRRRVGLSVGRWGW